MQALLDGAAFADRLMILVPHHGAVARRRHIDALHRGIAAGVFALQLVPDVEPGRDVPDALQQRQQPVVLGEVRHQVCRGAQPEDRVIIVDQGDLAVAHIDVARNLDERRFGRRHDAERIADRMPIPRHPEEQIGGARLVALEDRLGQHVEILVFADFVPVQQHRGVLRFSNRVSIAEARLPAGC